MGESGERSKEMGMEGRESGGGVKWCTGNRCVWEGRNGVEEDREESGGGGRWLGERESGDVGKERKGEGERVGVENPWHLEIK